MLEARVCRGGCLVLLNEDLGEGPQRLKFLLSQMRWPLRLKHVGSVLYQEPMPNKDSHQLLFGSAGIQAADPLPPDGARA